MQKIEGTTIKINRGDVLNLTLTLKMNDGSNYTFQNGDQIIFSVYEANNMAGEAVFLKTIDVSETKKKLEINLTSQETRFGELINKPVDYWYEIELNSQYTVIGYDENGAKILRLFPEGSKVI